MNAFKKAPLALLVTILLAAHAKAGTNTYSIGLNFGANEYPNLLGAGTIYVTNSAGVASVAQLNWNDLLGASGFWGTTFSTTNVANSNGVSIDTLVDVTWTSAGTWASTGRGEPNGDNFLTSSYGDHALMTGYLDTGNATTTTVAIANIPAALTAAPGGYDVYVYALGGAAGRGGSYRIVAADGVTVIRPYFAITADTSPTNYVLDPGVTHTNELGNYMVFRGLTQSSIIVEATPAVNPANAGTLRTPINAVQLVAAGSAGEASSATALLIGTNAGSGRLVVSWTPGAGSSGSLVLMRSGRAVSAEPVDGVVYNANASFGSGDNLGNDNIGSGNYAVFSGSASTVTVSNLSGASTYHIAVYSYTGSGAGTDYTLASPATTNKTPPAVLQSITVQLPATLQSNAIVQSVVLANFDSGPPANVTATSTFQSSNTNVFTVNAAGLVTGVGSALGANATITATYQGFMDDQLITTVAPPAPQLVHRYSFTTDATDSVGGAHGSLSNAASIVNGAVDLPNSTVLSSGDTNGAYVDLPNNIITNLAGVTFEVWLTDNGSANWGRVFDFGTSSGGEGFAGGGVDYMFLSIPGGGVTQSRGAYNPVGAGEGANQVNWTAGNGGRPQIGQRTHVVFATDPETRRGLIYVDGVLVATSTGFTASPRDIGPSFNNWLGRSQYNDPYWYGSIDEFRIWSNALTAFQVAVNAAAGPGTVAADPGALQSISVVAATTVEVGVVQSAGVLADFANVNDVNVTSGTIFSSSDTNVLTVSPAGVVTAVGVGSAQVMASFGGQNDNETITVVAPAPPVLTHRYSFAANANDSVGTAHGTNPQGTMVFANGTAVFDGFNTVQLPAGVISNYEAVTVEAWLYASNYNVGLPVYLFSFGETLATGAAANYVRLAVNDGNAALPVTQAAINGPVINNGQPVGGTTQAGGWGALLLGYTHVVAVFDAPRRQQRLYVDGQLVQTITTTVPVSLLRNVLSYIGQSLATTETYLLEAALDEFRIYNGAMNLEHVRTSLAAGPGNPQLSAGAYTSVSLNAPLGLIQGTRRLPTVTGSSTTLADVDLTQLATLSSSDTNVLRVITNGRVEAVNPGTATLTATMGSVSDNQTVQVVPKQIALMHRYGFTNDLSDSVSGGHGLAHGNAGTNGAGALSLDGTRSTYVDLPRYLVDGYSTITVEAWAEFLPTGNWTRLFDFGNYSAAARPGGNAYVFFAPRTGGASYRIAIDPAAGGGANAEQGTTAGTADLADGMKRHIVSVFQTDPAQQRYVAVYLDGVNVISNAAITVSMAGIVNDWNYIGRSLFTGDTFLLTQIDEFRIYHGALSPAQVGAGFAAGPDGAPAVGPLTISPLLDVARSGDNVVVSWTDPTFVLQAAPFVSGTYTNVPGATSPYTNAITNPEKYFRLFK